MNGKAAPAPERGRADQSAEIRRRFLLNQLWESHAICHGVAISELAEVEELLVSNTRRPADAALAKSP